MKFDLVLFACTSENREEMLVLTNRQYDAYVNGEPREGYFKFKYLGKVTLTDEVIFEVYEAEDELRNTEYIPAKCPETGWLSRQLIKLGL